MYSKWILIFIYYHPLHTLDIHNGFFLAIYIREWRIPFTIFQCSKQCSSQCWSDNKNNNGSLHTNLIVFEHTNTQSNQMYIVHRNTVDSIFNVILYIPCWYLVSDFFETFLYSPSFTFYSLTGFMLSTFLDIW